MATFFGEVVTGSYRYIDPDHPDYNDLRAAPQSWSLEPEEVKKEDNLLIITEGDIAGSYVRLLADEHLDTVARVISSGGAKPKKDEKYFAQARMKTQGLLQWTWP